ncbi:hypothetical protein NEF87_003275 [Candidatus Lokiarchaeum ossiferum]|uniref:Citrate transporter-like domain-containing protein n=1 Tax=Candidatus Lokiarchaeum ossiferum TaxID=2951803 RepID=A0ABY6HTZ1_9ARCH|nr:hypothetical protein NEF87_003275 [Candidatus Lokiarchaeum sp. B-35]
MTDYFSIIITLVLFVAVMIIFSQDKMDYVAYSMGAALIASVITALRFDTSLEDFVSTIEVTPLIFILSMQIMVMIAEQYKIFQWVAVKTLHITKGNHRAFFYLICIIGTITAAIIADVTVAIIFVPLVIRACRILNIRPAPYLFGITITINIGSIITPFSSSENILISSGFSLGADWFMGNMIIFVVIALAATLILLDLLMLKKQAPPEEARKKILLEIMDPSLVIINKKQFILNSIYFTLVILGFIFVSDYSYLIALLGAIVMSLLNKKSITDSMAKIDWKVIFFFISLFLLIGNMDINGTFDIIGNLLSKVPTDNEILMALGVLMITSLMSGFLANSPTAIVGITLLSDLYSGTPPNIVLIAFLLGINLGGNILPQGAACDIMTLNIATEQKVEGFTYKTLLKKGGTFALIHIGMCIIYLVAYGLIVS